MTKPRPRAPVSAAIVVCWVQFLMSNDTMIPRTLCDVHDGNHRTRKMLVNYAIAPSEIQLLRMKHQGRHVLTSPQANTGPDQVGGLSKDRQPQMGQCRCQTTQLPITWHGWCGITSRQVAMRLTSFTASFPMAHINGITSKSFATVRLKPPKKNTTGLL